MSWNPHTGTYNPGGIGERPIGGSMYGPPMYPTPLYPGCRR